ncbi:hypothetical protein JQ557_22305 [Bradyrhizobium sp. U87765 SZCCT0131]|uniref:hypothetical protein n=1 Tax=unclassified Bradyrhizobium TaxID=2631580 RepID=UPI001BAB883F|nr:MULTISPECIES: hypothetical protein [unclassified Bradyrhizobium]MBR1220751.1 hypothetical protein [Bradyrhizobium sp. U87765 SZCCT0131]MBR1260429.1 hypothetical protein [Bradyrhizobium sp. U87765 SZCCT0134]MBR1307322.1 hypothetical protein [Bradyrhizobium sp. U87765 SZCCT0110]MBR1321276.1 hypothetical protein [Bradyrhizobium sp. U87765 SZCCT0109]MBR1349589.1 hypothetical protein [Bradyrhizobium sp. U87765 SZCCT0048]
MTWGIPTPLFLDLHVGLSLVGIAAGIICVIGMVNGRHHPSWTASFLITTILTGVTGFPLAPFGLDPPRIVGIILLCVLAGAVAALYFLPHVHAARGVYVVCAVMALYLNVFVAVAQSFQKIGPLHALAPTGTEPPFLIAQVSVLGLFTLAGYLAFRNFRPPLFALPSSV